MQREIAYLCKHLTKIKRKQNNILIKQNKNLINCDDIIIKYERITNLFNETIIDKMNK